MLCALTQGLQLMQNHLLSLAVAVKCLIRTDVWTFKVSEEKKSGGAQQLTSNGWLQHISQQSKDILHVTKQSIQLASDVTSTYLKYFFGLLCLAAIQHAQQSSLRLELRLHF